MSEIREIQGDPGEICGKQGEMSMGDHSWGAKLAMRENAGSGGRDGGSGARTGYALDDGTADGPSVRHGGEARGDVKESIGRSGELEYTMGG